MLFNVKTEEKKNGRNWIETAKITNTVIVHDSLASDLYSNLIKDRTIRKIERKGQTLTVYYDRHNRAIYSVDYSILQNAIPVQNKP